MGTVPLNKSRLSFSYLFFKKIWFAPLHCFSFFQFRCVRNDSSPICVLTSEWIILFRQQTDDGCCRQMGRLLIYLHRNVTLEHFVVNENCLFAKSFSENSTLTNAGIEFVRRGINYFTYRQQNNYQVYGYS